MKKALRILGILIIVFTIIIVGSLYPKFSNMKSEYATATTIHYIQRYIEENGEWPRSASDLKLDKSNENLVHINYKITTKKLLENPVLLNESIRPVSGEFYTYPHYERDLVALLQAIKDSKNNSRDFQQN